MSYSSQDQRHLLKRLEKSLFQPKRALDHLRESVLITDPHLPDNPIVYANQAFFDLTGYDEKFVMGHNCRFLQGMHTNKKDVQKLRDAIKEQKPVTITLLNYRKDGTSFWNCLTVSPIFDEIGEIMNFVGIQRDVTSFFQDKKKLEKSKKKIEAMKKSLQNLQKRVKEQEEVIESMRSGVLH